VESKRTLPPTYLFISITSMVLLHFLIPVTDIASFPWSLLGLVPLLAGIVLNLLADSAFKKAQTTVKPFEKSSSLIVNGVFRISRHPMYLGMGLILFGIAILMGTLTPLFVVLVFCILMEKIFIQTEETMLAEQFGEEWITYRNNVRKWI
jgi:protein-S-isoprenylcysteine O-methyltransferase Ste14